MKTNNILKLIGLAAVLSLSACNDFLDKIPDSRMEVDNPDKIRKLLVTAYPRTSYILMFEIMSDNTTDNGSIQNWRYEEVQDSYQFKPFRTTGSDTPYGVWESSYRAINTANLALEAIRNLPNPSVCNPEKGEALLCRAYAHFILAHTFCMAYNPETSNTDLGVPYMTKPESSIFAKYPRGTVAGVYENIKQDIEEGLPLIEDNIYTVPKYHFNQKAAYAFAAEFFLYYGDYQKVLQYANRVIPENPSSVLRDMNEIRVLSSSNDIYNTYINAGKPANLLIIPLFSRWGRVHNTTGYRRYAHNKEICESQTYKSKGPWTGDYLSGFPNYGSTEYLVFTPKINEIFETTDPVSATGNPHVIWIPFTTDRTLLIRAEAYVMTKQYDKAAKDLGYWYYAKNRKSGQASYTAEEISDWYGNKAAPEVVKPINPKFTVEAGMQENMLQAVIHARRIEGVQEGVRWVDLKRFGISYTHYLENETDVVIEAWDKRKAIYLPEIVVAAGMEDNPR